MSSLQFRSICICSIFIIMTVWLAGCSAPGGNYRLKPAKSPLHKKISSPANPTLFINIHADRKLNPDSDGNPLSVVVRVYQLSSKKQWRYISIDSLWHRDTEVLGPNLLMHREVTMNPGEETSLKMKREKGAKHIAVASFYRKPKGHSWKKIIQVPRQGVAIHLLENQVKVLGK